MKTLSLDMAQKELPNIVRQAMRGESIGICVNNQEVAYIHPAKRHTAKPIFGNAKGRIKMADDFDAPIDDFEEYQP